MSRSHRRNARLCGATLPCSEKTLAVRQRREAEMARDRLPDISKAAPADRPRLRRRAEGEDGDVFARVVAAGRGRIAAVVGGDDGEVAGAQRLLDPGKPRVEGFER